MNRPITGIEDSGLPGHLSWGNTVTPRIIREEGGAFFDAKSGEVFPRSEVRVYADEPEKAGGWWYTTAKSVAEVAERIAVSNAADLATKARLAVRTADILAANEGAWVDGNEIRQNSLCGCGAVFDFCLTFTNIDGGVDLAPAKCPDCRAKIAKVFKTDGGAGFGMHAED